MFRPVSMCKLHILILARHVTPLTQALGSLGRVHLVNAVEQSSRHLLDGVDREAEIRDVERLMERCVDVLRVLGVTREAEVEGAAGLTRERIDALITEAAAKHRAIDSRMTALLQESGLLARETDRLRGYPVQSVRLTALRDLSHLYIVTGRLSPSLLPAVRDTLGERGLVLHDDGDARRRGKVLVLTSRRNRWSVDSDLTRLGFAREDLPEGGQRTPAEEAAEMDDRIEAIRRDLLACSEQIARLADEYAGPLLAAKQQLQGSLAILRAQQSYGRSTMLYCVSGWVPRDDEAAVRDLVDRVTLGSGVVEVIEPTQDERVRQGTEEVPVLFSPSRWLRPFQGLVTNFGAPHYNEIDPSPFVAISFVIMFGLMFGDLGQGLVVAGLGFWLLRTRRPALARWRDGGMLLALCGLSAAVFGVLYGSFFGAEELPFLRPIWLSPLHDVTRLLGTAVILGVVCISLAILINIANKMRNRRWFEGVFDKFGVLGIIFYWGSLGIGLQAARQGELDARGVVLLVLLPLALLFVREPLHNLLHRRKALHGDVFTFVLESCIETMETVTAFLGSTVSFVRVGAFALSHAALCLAIYSVMDIMRGLPGSTLWCAMVLVAGNLLVIFMEGMVAMIQGVRLQYYELFSKYFAGDGMLYHPFTLSNQTQAPTQEGEQES